jgi:hypothetical protein
VGSESGVATWESGVIEGVNLSFDCNNLPLRAKGFFGSGPPSPVLCVLVPRQRTVLAMTGEQGPTRSLASRYFMTVRLLPFFSLPLPSSLSLHFLALLLWNMEI